MKKVKLEKFFCKLSVYIKVCIFNVFFLIVKIIYIYCLKYEIFRKIEEI